LETTGSADRNGSATNYTFLIDTSQIYLIRSTSSLTSNMVFCDGTYLNTQYMDESDPHRVYGLIVYYNYNNEYTPDEDPSTLNSNNITDEPDRKKPRRNTFERIRYFESKYFDFEKYKAEMSEEVINGINVEKGINTSRKDAVGQIKWVLVF